MITEPTQEILERTKHLVHPFCVVCSRAGNCWFGLSFNLLDDGGVESTFECSGDFQGYEGLLHGGVISSLLDGAMTNCLFAHGLAAVTAEMTVRFRHPVRLETPLLVRAHVVRFQPPLFVVEAQLLQEDQVRVTGTGKFMEQPEIIAPDL